MRMRGYSGFAVFWALLLIGACSAASCTSTGANFKVLGVNWGNATNHISAGPGEMDVPLTITLQSYGLGGNTCNLVNLEGSLKVYGGLSNFNGSSYPTDYIQQASVPSTFSMTFNLNIAKNLSAGNHTVYGYFLYLYYNYTNTTARNSQSINIGIPLYGSPRLSFTPTSRGVVAGVMNNLTVQVHNSGSGTAYYIRTAASGSSSLEQVNYPQPIASLAPGETKNITLQVYVSPGLAGQAVTFGLNPTYVSPYGYNTSAAGNLSLYALSALQSSVSLSASTVDLQGGSTSAVLINITNTGASTIENVSAILSAQSPLSIIGSSGYYNFKGIAPGATVSIPAELYVASSSSSGSTVANLDVQLGYDGQSESSPRILSFLTPGYINLTQVSTSVLPSSPSVGGIFSLTSTLNNIGTSSASAVTVTAHPPKGIESLGSNTTFIGDISPDNPTAFTVSFIVPEGSKPGRYVIPVEIDYLNNLNQRVSTSMNFSVDIAAGAAAAVGSQGQQSRKGGSGGVVPLVIILIAIGVGVYLYRKSKAKVQKR